MSQCVACRGRESDTDHDVCRDCYTAYLSDPDEAGLVGWTAARAESRTAEAIAAWLESLGDLRGTLLAERIRAGAWRKP